MGFDHELARAAEQLVIEYEGRLPITTVIRVLSEVAHAHPGSCAERTEDAARERLQTTPDSGPLADDSEARVDSDIGVGRRRVGAQVCVSCPRRRPAS